MTEIALIILKLPGGDIVMQRRDNNAPTSPNALGFFGGHMEAGETPEEAMKRELAEETSLDISTLDIIHEFSCSVPSPDQKDTRKVHVFSAGINDADFEVYEGVGSETHDPKTLLGRNDLAYVVRYLFENFPQIR